MIRSWLFTLALLFIFPAFAQQHAYRISVTIDGYPFSVAYLGNYFGNKLAIADTAVRQNGVFEFSGPEALEQGIYFMVSKDKKKLFEFIIGEQQYFSIERKYGAAPEQTRFRGSPENDIFYAYLTHNKASYRLVNMLREKIQALPDGHDSIAYYTDEIKRINRESIEYKLNIVEEHPGSMTALLFNVMREPEVPEFFTEDGRQDSLSAYLYYRNHYWEHVDLGDDRFLRTPVFHRKLERYMQEVIPAHPDSIISEIDLMLEQTSAGSEMQNYLLWYFTNTYETSKVMGYDKIFVHMVDTYFTGRGYDWLDPTVQQNMIRRAGQLRNVLIGSSAPNLVMADTSGQFLSLSELDAEYTIIIFWSSTCGECKKEALTISDLQRNAGLDMEVFGVNTDTTLSKWTDFIDRHGLDWVHVNGNASLTGDYHDLYDIYSSPTIYVLDRDKAIIAKRIEAEKIPGIIDYHKKLKTKAR